MTTAAAPLPSVGERVTVADVTSHRVGRGRVLSVFENVINGEECRAFTIALEGGGKIHMWSFAPDFVEGVGWARGWDGVAVAALAAVQALLA